MSKTKYMLALLAAAGLLAACDRGAETEPARQQADPGTTATATDAGETGAADEGRSEGAPGGAGRPAGAARPGP